MGKAPSRRRVDPQLFPEHMRQLDFYDPETYDPHVTIIGAGGIGSPTAVQLAKLGVRHFTIYDADIVSLHNLATTPYRHKDLGKNKAETLAKILKEANPRCTVRIKPQTYQGGKLPRTDILISAVDSMAARKIIFKAAVKQKIPVLVDGRIGGEDLRVYVIRPGSKADRALYNASWKPDKKIPPLPCSRQQVADIASTISGLITRAVRQWEAEKKYNREIALNVDSLELYVSPPIFLLPEPPAMGAEPVES